MPIVDVCTYNIILYRGRIFSDRHLRISLDSKNQHYSLKILTPNVKHTYIISYTLCIIPISDQKIPKTFLGENRRLLFGAFARRPCVVFLASRVKYIVHGCSEDFGDCGVEKIAIVRRLQQLSTHNTKFVPIRFKHNMHSSTLRSLQILYINIMILNFLF